MYYLSSIFPFVLMLLLNSISVNSQEVYTHVSNKEIYFFLDELAEQHLIELNSTVKPYSRYFIAKSLEEALQQTDKLTNRQKAELDFYLRDYYKELLPGKDFKKRVDIIYYKDSLFTLSLNPILGVQYWSNENGTNYHRWNGAEAFAYVGKHLGIYASLRDNHEEQMTVDTGYLNMRSGVNYKAKYDYSEMRGGINLSWKWGTVGLVKDHMEWGSGYTYPNIISAKAPSFAQLKLQLKPVEWFEFNYFHGWLVSEVVDSSRSYNYNGIQRDVFHGKWMAANMFSFRPFKKVWFSIGNSIVYSDIGVQPAYLIPIFFYKSVDHTYNATRNTTGQNSQLFFDVNIRSIKYTTLYYSMFIDEFSIERMFDEENQSNHWSIKWGARISNLIPNIILTTEYTRNNALVYRNDNTTTLYNSNWYNMGHYLGDNADEIYTSLEARPLKKFSVKMWYTYSRKGPYYPYDRSNRPEGGINIWGKPFMESVEWSSRRYGLGINYQFLNDMFIFGNAEFRSVNGNQTSYTSPFYYGNTTTFSLGVNWGF